MKASADVRHRLAGLYVLFASVTATGMYLSNKYISRSSPEELALVLIGLIVGNAIILVPLILFTYACLREPHAAEPAHAAPDREMREWIRLTNFPKALFWWVLASGVIATQAYRLAVLGLPPWPPETFAIYVRSTLFNVSTFMAMAMVHYSAARWVLRHRIRELRVYRLEGVRFGSLSTYAVFVFGFGLCYLLLRALWYAVNSERAGAEPEGAVLLATGGAVFAVTFTVVCMMAYYLFRDIDWVTAKLRSLASTDRSNMLAQIPVASPYESGELIAAFNALQERFDREYKRVDRELDLARQVQLQFFRDRPEHWLGWRLQREEARQSAIGGVFHDIVPCSNRRLLLAAGFVTGTGLPSALVMSALIMLLRAKADEGIDPGKLLAELNASLHGMMPGGLCAHVSLAVIDEARGELLYAAAGDAHVLMEDSACGGPYRSNTGTEALGIDPDAVYGTASVKVPEGDCRMAMGAGRPDTLIARRNGGERHAAS